MCQRRRPRNADAAAPLVDYTACRRRSREIAEFVARYGADGAKPELVCLRMNRTESLLFFRFRQLEDTFFGQEILVSLKCYTLIPSEPRRAFADQEDVLAFLHDGAGKQYGIPDPAHASDRAGVENAAIHD